MPGIISVVTSEPLPQDLDPAALVATMPYAVHTGVEIAAASKQEVVGHLDWAPDR